MFLDFYQLREQPFGVTPDPAYLYPSRTHCEALDSLTEAIQGDHGFLALIAEPGLGKTTLMYQVLEGLRDTARAAFLFQTQCNSREFFEYLLADLGVDTAAMGLVAMHSKLNEILFTEMLAGRRFVLIVDEAQNLDDSVLETIRLLSNFETSNTKLLQIVLAGQPQLGEKLAQPHLAQLLQRITLVKYLEPLSPEETAGYISHRLKVAGHRGDSLFEPDAVALIAEQSRGIPRIINKLCFRSLLEGYARGCSTISPDIVEKAQSKLNFVPAAAPAVPVAPPLGVPAAPPMPAPPTATASAAVSAEAASASTTSALTYKSRAHFALPAWALWVCALLAVLLSAGLALPRSTLRQMRETLRNQVAATNSLAQRKQAHDGLQAQGVLQSAANRYPGGSSSVVRETPNITAIQASNLQNDAHVVVLLDNPVQFDSARITSPDRIYFDLHKAQLRPSVGLKTVPGSNGLLQGVRASQFSDDVVRLVLDADGAKEYSAQLLPDPYRLVIEVHSQSSTNSSLASAAATQNALPAESALPTLAHDPQPFLSRELGLKISRIAIDPGHGGYDTGSKGPQGLLEKDLCLDVAMRLGQLIEEHIAGAEVIYTRKDDRRVSLEERTSIANAANADLFISIHANSSDFREARGAETYYLSLATSPQSRELATRENASAQSSLHELSDLVAKIARNDKIAESKLLAVDIQNTLSQRLQLVNGGEKNRGVKQAPFVVLTGANMPAVLSEISFVSNASDESLLLESGQRQRVAEGLYRGIAAYLNGLQGVPHAKQKLVTENSSPTSSGLASSPSASGRSPR
ncbi:MAG TPA: N-acetylmuramoyl-L-alanine amidase [Candidatus Acidoferrum sp.]|nr:N-acetylmuramoyl-L-alanine amidase [Candidatus Acidoferrum sp.]